MRTCFISFSYPPSKSSLSELEQISLADLLLETHHREKMLIIRTFGHAIRISGVQIAVEDSHGHVDRLALYNNNATLPPQVLLPTGAIFAIKEPYYKKTADGGYNVRVDHPSDLIPLEPEDAVVPASLRPRLLELDKSALDFKMEANRMYEVKRFEQAVETYTRALKSCSDADFLLKCDILRNRAIVRLRLGHYEPALEDAMSSLITPNMSSDDDLKVLDVKARFRAGCASYHMGDFASAELQFETIMRFSPSDGDAMRELARTRLRMYEQETGIYDFDTVCQPTKLQDCRLDRACHISKTEVRSSGSRGRGLFAITDFAPGDLILCEKAACIAYESDHSDETYTIINVNTERGAVGPRARLFFDLVTKMRHNPTMANRFFDLYDGGYSPKGAVVIADGEVVIDTFRTQAIIDYNAFACLAARARDNPTGKLSNPAKEGSVGVWIVASYTNHACNFNAARTFIGDMMIVRASRNIDKGDEILTPYWPPEGYNTATHHRLENTWGFKCDCVICMAENKSSVLQKTRQQLRQEIKAFLSVHRQTATKRPSNSTITRAERLYRRHQDLCDKCLPRIVPRLELAELGVWLCQAYTPQAMHSRIFETAISALKDLNYLVEVTPAQKLSIDYNQAYLCFAAIDAAVSAAHAQHKLSNIDLGHQFLEFARSLYRTLHIGLHGFEERYGAV
jgi:tetratricopeptide (TPR) repeat protein